MIRRTGRRLSKARHHTHTGRAVVTIDGRAIYLGRWGTLKAEASSRGVGAQYKTTGRVDPLGCGAANGDGPSAFVPAIARAAHGCLNAVRNGRTWLHEARLILGRLVASRGRVPLVSPLAPACSSPARVGWWRMRRTAGSSRDPPGADFRGSFEGARPFPAEARGCRHDRSHGRSEGVSGGSHRSE